MTTPPGWKLVPEEPTQEMRDAADALPDTFSIGDEWRAMFAVAPQPPTRPEPSVRTEAEVAAIMEAVDSYADEVLCDDRERKLQSPQSNNARAEVERLVRGERA